MNQLIRLIGIGQPLRGDDALGLEAVQAWQRQHHSSSDAVEVLVLESPGLTLLEALTDCSAAIIVDSVRSTGQTGDIYVLSESDLASFGPAAASAHGLGVAEAVAFARTLYPEKLAPTIQFIGIEAGTIQVGDPISSAGRQALPALVDQIQLTLDDISSHPAQRPTRQPMTAGD